MRIKLFYIAVLFSTLSFLASLQAWFLWNIPHGLFSLLAMSSLSLLIYKMRYDKSITISKLIFITCLFISIYMHFGFSNISSIISQFFTILLCLCLCILPDIVKIKLLDKIISFYSIILFISLSIHCLLLIGISVPSIGPIENTEHVSFYTYTNYIFHLKGNYGIRFHSIFCEPGHVGMINAFLLYILQFNLKDKRVIILLLSLLFSLSLAGYLLLSIGYTIHLMTTNIKKGMLLILGVIFFLIIVFNLFIKFVGEDNFFYEMIISRLIYDSDTNTIVGDNRITNDVLTFYNNLDTADLLFGVSEEEYKYVQSLGGGAGFRLFIIKSGIISITLVLIAYYNIAKQKGKITKENLGLFILFILSFIQRAYPFWSSIFIIFILGTTYIYYKKCKSHILL